MNPIPLIGVIAPFGTPAGSVAALMGMFVVGLLALAALVLVAADRRALQ
jgi:hypothetical protein